MLQLVCVELTLKFKGTPVLDLFQCQIKFASVHVEIPNSDEDYVSNDNIKK